MSASPLVDYTRLSPNRTAPRGGKISKITIHHMAGMLSVETCGAIFAEPGRQASSNYGVDGDGRVGLYVDEAHRSWASSSSANDNVAVTIEVANSALGGDWPVSNTALAKTIDLCADICRRNGIPRLNFTGDASGNLTQHNYFAATACPGPYLKSKFQYIADEVNKRLGASPGDIPAAERPTLQRGCVGESVRELQTLLGGLDVDGVFGSATEEALKLFQWSRGLEADGICGPLTWAALLSKDDESPPAAQKTDIEITVENAAADGVVTSPEYWLGVLSGEIAASPGNVKALIDKYHEALAGK